MSKSTTEKKIISYTWTGTHIIMGIPTRNLTVEEYKEYIETIKLAETATQVTIYKPMFEEASE